MRDTLRKHKSLDLQLYFTSPNFEYIIHEMVTSPNVEAKPKLELSIDNAKVLDSVGKHEDKVENTIVNSMPNLFVNTVLDCHEIGVQLPAVTIGENIIELMNDQVKAESNCNSICNDDKEVIKDVSNSYTVTQELKEAQLVITIQLMNNNVSIQDIQFHISNDGTSIRIQLTGNDQNMHIYPLLNAVKTSSARGKMRNKRNCIEISACLL